MAQGIPSQGDDGRRLPATLITGMGCVCGAGRRIAELLPSLLAGNVRCNRPPEWLFATDLDYPVFAGSPDPLTSEARAFFTGAASSLDGPEVSRTVQLALSAVGEALEQAGLPLEVLRGKRVGIALGTTVGCTFQDEEYYSGWRQEQSPDPDPVRYFLESNIAAALHRILGTQGPSAVITNACASGTDAIGLARDWIAAGQCDLAIAGGADALSRVAYNGFVSLLLADTESCRPFSEDRNGLNLGEGAGVLILEPESAVRERGIVPIGRVLGYGSAADAYHPTAPHPEGRGLQCAFRMAVADAGISSNEIALINAHGTGTPANDIAETIALAKIDLDPEQTVVVSTKGVTGHTLGAAGGIEAIFTILALRAGTTTGTIGCSAPDPQFPIIPLIQGTNKALTGNVGVSQSLAFGGGNGVLVLEGLP